MSMSFGGSSADAVSLPLKPCSGCRRRKVRCDKLRPCTNCSRSRQKCSYDGNDSIISDTGDAAEDALGDSDLRDRLTKLEEMMAVMMREKEKESSRGPNTLNGKPNYDPTTSTQNQRPSLTSNASSSWTKGSPVGQIVYQEGEGAYFRNDFWLSLVPEIEDLRRIFDTHREQDASEYSSSLSKIPSVYPTSNFTSIHPSVEQSNVLITLFFESVNPFIRVLHQALFARELDQYRRGTYIWPKEFEALLFSIYLLTISSLRAGVVEQLFSESKDTLLLRYQSDAQATLTRINFFKTQKIAGIWALLHYVTFLFQQNMYRDAAALLGTTARQAQAMGLHRDPSHFPFSPWVCEIRRRIWNHICILDGLCSSSYGFESCLPATSDAKPPQNANDSDWHASRFANPSSVPSELKGFKDMSYLLSQRDISDTIRACGNLGAKCVDEKSVLLASLEARLLVCLQNDEVEVPMYTAVKAAVEIQLSMLKLSVQYQKSKDAGSPAPDLQDQSVFISALDILESLESHAKTFSSFNWESLFNSTIPWLATLILITRTSTPPTQDEQNRAQHQIDRIFSLHESLPISQTPMWKMLVQLRSRIQGDLSSGEEAEVLADSRTGYVDDFMLDMGDDLFDEQLMADGMVDMPWLASTSYN